MVVASRLTLERFLAYWSRFTENPFSIETSGLKTEKRLDDRRPVIPWRLFPDQAREDIKLLTPGLDNEKPQLRDDLQKQSSQAHFLPAAGEFGNYKEKSGQELRVLCPNLTDDSQISLLPLGFSLHFLGIGSRV